MRKILAMIIVSIFTLAGCQESSKEFDLEESIKNKDIVIINKSKDIVQVLQGQVKIHNHVKLNEFINEARVGEEKKVNIINVASDGTHKKSVLSSKDGEIIFENKYVGFQKANTYECKEIVVQAPGPGITLTGCKDYDNPVFIAPYSIQDFREAGAKEKIQD